MRMARARAPATFVRWVGWRGQLFDRGWRLNGGGFMHGALAPGHKSAFEAAIAAHRLMQGHARAVQRYEFFGAATEQERIASFESKCQYRFPGLMPARRATSA